MTKPDAYLLEIQKDLESILRQEGFFGKLEVEINIKDGAITNMNIAPRRSVKL